MIAIRMIIYTLAMVVVLYLTQIQLPESLKLNVNVSTVLFVVIVMLFFRLSTDKWWMKIVSAVLGIAVFLVLINILGT